MSTGQKYSGKGEDATPPTTNGSSINQTVENAEQTVNPTQQPTPDAELGTPKTYSFKDLQAFSRLDQEDKELHIQRHREGADINWPPLPEGTYPGGPFQFDDVLLYDRLTENGKFYADWIATNKIGFTSDQLKLALDWLSKSPDSASPTDKVDSMSLLDILGGKVTMPQPPGENKFRHHPSVEAQLTAILSNPAVEIAGVFDYKGRTYVRLTDYLEERLTSNESADACREEFRKIFTTYMFSDKFIALEDPEKTKKVTDMMSGISLLMGRVGRYYNPKPLRTDITTEDILENPFSPEYHEAVMLESGSITDVAMLQEWVERLQRIVAIQMELNNNLNKLVDPRTELIEVMRSTLLTHEATIERLQREVKENAVTTNYNIPKTHPYIDLTLYTAEYDSASEVELVHHALTEYRDKLGVKILELIVNGETSEAFDHHEEQSSVNNVLERLTRTIAALASNGYKVAEYTRDPSLFLTNVARQRQKNHAELRAFEKKYSTRYDVDDEETDPEAPAQTDPQQPTE